MNLREQVVPWGEIGYITFKRTYARRLKEDDPKSRTEEFWQVIERELKASEKQLKVNFTPEEKEEYARTRMNLLWSVAGRFMWQLGTRTVDELGLPSLQNCAFVTVDEPITPFTWAMDMLMLGSGVGYNIQREFVYQIPKVLKRKIKIQRIDTKDADFIVPDTREGWVKLLGKVLKAHFYSGEGFSYSTQLIRSKGAPIKGFGGTAAGPEELCWGMEQIHQILQNRSGQKLRPIDCLDIMNIIGFIVVAGNVRRSAQIAIGDHDDIEFIKAKRWDLGPIPNWRSMSNNSVVCDNIEDLIDEFWQTYQQGEPYGLINLRLSRAIGRTGETKYSDPDVGGYNPCSEQSLVSKETCCLADTYLPRIKTYEELITCLTFAYRMNKHSLALKCHLKDTQDIVHKNMRMGIGITGVLEASKEQLSWLPKAYEYLRKYDEEYSKKHGFPTSIKLTTVKPSGTLSLLPGVTPGCHPSPAGPYYIRRIRIAVDSPLIDVCRKHGYPVEYQRRFDGSNDPTTMVVSFPCKVSDTTPIAADLSWKEQLDTVRWLQANWSDNSVSCTIYYKHGDIPEIKEYLKKHWQNEMKSVSFLLYQGHGFDQAPYETITKDQYDELIQNITPITNVEINESDFALDECENGACPIK